MSGAAAASATSCEHTCALYCGLAILDGLPGHYKAVDCIAALKLELERTRRALRAKEGDSDDDER